MFFVKKNFFLNQFIGHHVRGMLFKYKNGENIEEVKLNAVSSPEEEKKHSLAWIAAMQRVRNMHKLVVSDF